MPWLRVYAATVPAQTLGSPGVTRGGARRHTKAHGRSFARGTERYGPPRRPGTNWPRRLEFTPGGRCAAATDVTVRQADSTAPLELRTAPARFVWSCQSCDRCQSLTGKRTTCCYQITKLAKYNLYCQSESSRNFSSVLLVKLAKLMHPTVALHGGGLHLYCRPEARRAPFVFGGSAGAGPADGSGPRRVTRSQSVRASERPGCPSATRWQSTGPRVVAATRRGDATFRVRSTSRRIANPSPSHRRRQEVCVSCDGRRTSCVSVVPPPPAVKEVAPLTSAVGTLLLRFRAPLWMFGPSSCLRAPVLPDMADCRPLLPCTRPLPRGDPHPGP